MTHTSLNIRTVPRYPVKSFAEYSKAFCGVHAARVQSPVVSWISRFPSDSPLDPALVLDVRSGDDTLKIRSVRGTLHHYHYDDVTHFHQATLSKRLSICRYLSNKLQTDRVEYFMASILELLSDGGQHPKSIEGLVIRQTMNTSEDDLASARIALKTLFESGRVILRDDSDTWNREIRRFEIPSDRWRDILNTTVSHPERRVIDRYLQSYGPATLEDIAWWSGFSKKVVQSNLDDLIRGDVVSWLNISSLKFYDTNRDRSLKYSSRSLQFFGWEETALKAFYQTRNRYISNEYYDLAFNKIGEVRRTVFHDHKLVGTWEVQKDGKPVNFQLFPTYQYLFELVSDSFEAFKNKFFHR